MKTPLGTTPLIAVLRLAIMALALKVWVSIVAEYRFYFPANFSASFLIGREDIFVGLYPVAFYAHILVGPVTLLLAGWLMLAAKTSPSRRLHHRRLGRVQSILVIGVLVPSGLVMAWDAHTGPAAAWGFGLHAAFTGASMFAAIRSAVRRDLSSHRRWAKRCFLCLIAPVILRISMGASIALGFESDAYYQFNAWASWLVPLAIYQSVLIYRKPDLHNLFTAEAIP